MIINDIVSLAKVSLYVTDIGDEVVGHDIDADKYGEYEVATGWFKVTNPTLRHIVVHVTNVACKIHTRYMRMYWRVATWNARRKGELPF